VAGVEILFAVGIILLAAFVVGAVARLAVPGPDPMPVWLTIAIGIAGAVVGSVLFGIVGALVGEGEPAQPAPGATEEEVAVGALLGAFFVSLVGATILVVLFRKLVQKRPLTGPEAQRPGLRPRGLRRILTGRPHRYYEETASPEEGWAPDQLQKLVLLRDAGKISEEEYERRKAALVQRL
jgi:uncharacterized membrane protein YeaQ/YmgE (transglycosylase-associated protein family)